MIAVFIGLILVVIDGEIDSRRLKKTIKEANIIIEKEKRRLYLEKIEFLTAIYNMFKDEE